MYAHSSENTILWFHKPWSPPCSSTFYIFRW